MLQKLIMMFLSRGGGGSLGKLLGPLAGMLAGGGAAGGTGGLGDILGKFQKAGLGDKADSWVGSGRNSRLSADDVRSALGRSEVERIARDAGISEKKAASGLARLIPQAVDKATPAGRVDDSATLDARSVRELFS